jgi:hypothetical protein
MASQYQQPQDQGQYFAPQQGVEKNMAHNPNQQQPAYWNAHNVHYSHAPPGAVYTPPTSGTGRGAPASSGVKRSSCFALTAVLLLLIAAVIGLSAGLGVSQRNLRNAKADLARATGS